jgi:sulfur-carrier protein adenylyltransferase/sulfurtransferase
VRRDPGCPACGEHRTVTSLIDYAAFCGVETAAPPVPSISARELHARLSAGERFTLLDVREPHEWEIANLAEYGARLIPLADVAESVPELDLSAPIVVHCRSGARSAKAVRTLAAAGARQVWNLDGGILAWSDSVDPGKARY